MEERKFCVVEVAEGDFIREFQQEFEEAQRIADVRGLPVCVTAKVMIEPPKKGERWGEVQYELDLRQPKKTSRAHPAEWKDGRIVSTGDTISEIMQEKLDLEIPEPFEIRRGKEIINGEHR